jgi:hypothetical protein
VNTAAVTRDPEGWTVVHNGRAVVTGESFAVADNIAAALRGEHQPSGECAEVAESILAAASKDGAP